ncbi:MAG TPA: hypothetical protein VFT29_19785 [Gemmatimonadaceae bacterium]|nr:hypothetical protein [Gemmatimonadaceae bacterium]
MTLRLALGALAGAFGILACDHPVRPHFPGDAVALQPPGQYALWWDVTKQCSGISTTPDVLWYVVPGVNEFEVGEEAAAGLWWPDSNRIVIAEGFLNDGLLVRHEMLHALGRFEGHPSAYYREKCGGIVSCGGHGCLKEAGPLPILVTAMRVNPADMQVSVSVSPTVYSKTNGGWVVVTVSVTNSRPVPVWVKLTPQASSSSAETFGFRLAPSITGTHTTASREIGFAPGETKRASFDLHLGVLGGISPGSYAVRGVFNNDTTPAVFLSVP